LTVLDDDDVDSIDDLVAALDEAIATGEPLPSPDAKFSVGYYSVMAYNRRGLLVCLEPSHLVVFSIGRSEAARR
jgi:hypothetical protein